jgi:acyl-CoA reductase-like NAD-dependent aldehyde dehydrogenase
MYNKAAGDHADDRLLFYGARRIFARIWDVFASKIKKVFLELENNLTPRSALIIMPSINLRKAAKPVHQLFSHRCVGKVY